LFDGKIIRFWLAWGFPGVFFDIRQKLIGA
jgi:hypothetical protein